MVSVLMRDEDVPDGIALAVEEDVRHPFAHTGDTPVDPAGIQRLEDLLASVHLAHFFFLKLGCFL